MMNQEKKSERLIVSLTPSERAMLSAIAEVDHCSLAHEVRHLIRDAYQKLGAYSPAGSENQTSFII